jgi:hypothetical protein
MPITGIFRPKRYVKVFKNIVQGLSGLEELEVMTAESPRHLAEAAEGNLREMVSRMDESELREYNREF